MAYRTAIKKPPVYRVVGALSVLLVLLTVGLFAIDAVLAYSVLAGGLINLLPQVYFNYLAFKFAGARSTHLVVRSIYLGEAVKFALTGVLFAVVFVMIKPLNVLAVFISFVSFQVLSLVGNAIMVTRPGGGSQHGS